MGSGSVPNRVFRFYGNNDYALDVVRRSEITLINARLMNDPYDPYFFFEMDFQGGYRDLVDAARKMGLLSWFIQNINEDMWNKAVASLGEKLDFNRNSSYLFCCSGQENCINSNMYMWGHYGSGHRGIAIEFDPRCLLSGVDIENIDGMRKVYPAAPWMKVAYKDNINPLKSRDFVNFYRELGKGEFQNKVSNYFEMMLCTKSKFWSFENEWRIVYRKDVGGEDVQKMEIDRKAIKAIYIGMCASSDVVDMVCDVVRSAGFSIPVWKMKKGPGLAGLGRIEV